MDTVNIQNHNKMEQYDFSKPINVTIIFEDADEESSDKKVFEKNIENDNSKLTEECLNENQKLEKSNIECDVKHKVIWIEESVIIEQSNNNNNVTGATEKIQATNNTTHKPETNNPDQNMEQMNNQNPLTEQYNTSDNVAKGNNNISDHQNGNNHEELDDYIDALLNVVSENLILIIRPYQYYYYRSKEVTEEIKIYLNKLKIHFFDLSYSTVVTLILPQENNKKFVKNFIDKTVVIANKVLTWKCGRTNVEPFYNEMVIWTKKKRDHITKLKLLQPNYNKITNGSRTQESRILKQHPANPPKQLHTKHPKKTSRNKAAPVDASAINPSDQILNAENRKCILSAGPPGREITINIDPDMLSAHINQYNNNHKENHGYEICRNNYNSTNISASNVQLASNQAQYHYNVNHQNTCHLNNTLHYNPPPPYNISNQNHNTLSPYHVHRNYIQENMEQNNQMQRFAIPAHSNSNCEQMYTTHSKEQITSLNSITQLIQQNNHPVITSVVSINSRCCICGKTSLDTRTRCLKCNKQVYCGYLCQELDAGGHNIRCGKT